MTKTQSTSSGSSGKQGPSKLGRKVVFRRLGFLLAALGCVFLVAIASGAWLANKASTINNELTSGTKLIPGLRDEITTNDAAGAAATVQELLNHTSAAKQAADDPVWNLASTLPGLGANLSAITEVARSADDVANLSLAPLVRVYGSLNWETLLPNSSGTDLEPLEAASPSVSAAAHAVRQSADRLGRIDASKLMPQVSTPLTSARDQLRDLASTLDTAANVSSIAPRMLGSQAPRTYLLIIQNNAEARASGGIPGALAVLSVDKGSLALGFQSSASDVGTMSPIIPVDAEQEQIYSRRLGKFMQDVNLTPDFPTVARTAQSMWERKYGQRVDGVISVDPVALGFILDATGPITLTLPENVAISSSGMPTELTGENVVQTLLSDVYARIDQPAHQDLYFASVAKEIFSALSGDGGNAKGLLAGLTRGANEGRVSLWSAVPAEQSVIAKYALGGSIAGSSVSPAQFAVYFNDGTGAKMDYYVKRTVQLVKACPRDGYEETKVRVTSTNTAPSDAASTLPAYVTGGGNFGVPPGSVQTNIVAYGPTQANVETATLDGQRIEFAPYLHSNRPVGVLAIRLAPGESKTVEFTFGKIVQHTEPNLVVTPTVEPVKDVILATESATCSG